MRLTSIIEKWRNVNDGTRLLMESIIVPEVQLALKDWFKNANSNYALIRDHEALWLVAFLFSLYFWWK